MAGNAYTRFVTILIENSELPVLSFLYVCGGVSRRSTGRKPPASNV